MWNRIIATLNADKVKYSLDLLLLHSPKGSLEDPEYVLFYEDSHWRAVGPVDYPVANALIGECDALGLPCFICCEEEFMEKGLPADPLAVDYFPQDEEGWSPQPEGVASVPLTEPQEVRKFNPLVQGGKYHSQVAQIMADPHSVGR
ncbi:hypothetical protein [Desulfobulbus propionicus]